MFKVKEQIKRIERLQKNVAKKSNKSVFSLFFIFLFIILVGNLSFISSLDVTTEGQIGIDLIPTTPINYSTVNVNNSEYLQGYTPTTLRDWMQTTYDTIYCKLTGCTMSGNINLGNNNITNSDTGFFTNLGSALSRITKGWFSGLDVDGNVTINDTLIVGSSGNFTICENSTQATYIGYFEYANCTQ